MGGRWLIKNRTSDYSAIFVIFILKFYSFPIKKKEKNQVVDDDFIKNFLATSFTSATCEF